MLIRGAVYRVKKPFSGAPNGTLLTFREVNELKPSGEDAWFFVGTECNVMLRDGDEADRAVLDSLDQHLERVSESSSS